MRGAAPIGVFDSGVGGLTVLKALAAALPGEGFVYLGDTARLPYGTKSDGTVTRYALQAAALLAAHRPKCLVVACNTASSVGLPALAAAHPEVPVVGVIEPGAQAACAASPRGRIAVIGTEGTVRRGAYQETIRRLRPAAQVTAIATPLLVALAEEGLCTGPIAQAVAAHYLGALFGADRGADRPDTLVLGCTHFPMLAQSIAAVVGPDVRIVDSAATTAARVRELLGSSGRLSGEGGGGMRFLATDAPERFARIGGRFLERDIDALEVELVDL